jgi:hypothetical protein
LQYNVKVDSHRRTQADLRKIQLALEKQGIAPAIKLPDLHVSCVKPEWLCGTFAFHPMLGFKRGRQACSIAHGCASTLAHLDCEQQRNKMWTSHWWKPFELRPGVCIQEEGPDISFKLKPQPINAAGDCCFVQGRQCPFSRPELERVQKEICGSTAKTDPGFSPLGKETIAALHEIYIHCGRIKTHQRPPD